MKSVKIKIDPENKKAVEALEEATTTLLTMKVVLVDGGGLGMKFECDSATVEAFDTFMPKGWLTRFMEQVAAAVADNKKMYKLMRGGTAEIKRCFARERPDLKMKRGEPCVD